MESASEEGRDMIYIAGPYMHKNSHVRNYRYHMHRNYLIQLMEQGRAAYSPIAVGHTLLPDLASWTHDRWMLWDLPILRLCKEVHLLKLPGWDKSRGTTEELELARDLGMEITEVEWEL